MLKSGKFLTRKRFRNFANNRLTDNLHSFIAEVKI